MASAVITGAVLICLMWITMVYCTFIPPCMSQLGLKKDGSHHLLTFDVATSDGQADDIRLNGPNSWIPLTESFVEINISQVVLLTALQVQGDTLLSGRVTGWILETSIDCESYHAENYSLNFAGLVHTETVLLKSIEFVSCIRLRPTHYIGKTPALRLELLGCAVNDNSRCGHEAYPTTEIWMEGGGLQLNFGQEVVLVWIKVLLESKTHLHPGVLISYSRSCEKWKDYETSNMNTVTVASLEHGSHWVTSEMEVPIRVRCLRVFPPDGTVLIEAHTSACSSQLSSNLQEIGTKAKPDIHEQTTETSATTSVPATVDSDTTYVPTTEASTTSIPATDTSPTTSVSATVETTFPMQTTETGFNQNSQQMYSTGSPLTTISHVNESSISDNISVHQVNHSDNDSVNNISISTVVTLQDTNYTDFFNKPLENSTIAGVGTDIDDTTERQTNSYSNDDRDDFTNNSKNQSSTTKTNHKNIIYVNKNNFENEYNETTFSESTSNASVSDDLMQQNNSTFNAHSPDLGIHKVSDNTTKDLYNKDYNKTVCGVKNSAKLTRKKRVVSGNINSPGEWPWLVSMHYLIDFDFTIKSGFKHTCGASLIAPDWIITAAHCFSDDLLNGLSNLTSWRVYFGIHDLNITGNNHLVQERLIEAVYMYPRYNITIEPLLYDLALVKLNESVEVNDRVSPVCLDDETDLHEQESQCYVSGWGQISLTSPGSRFPHTASMSTMTLSKCRDMYNDLPDNNEVKPFVRIEAPILCAAIGNKGEDACQGDSGGPLMCERDGHWYQAGIVAGGYLCGHKATPGLYSRIAYYINWIRTTMDLYDD